jgi:hypothetical protein
MSIEHSPGETGPPPRRGPSVDIDPTAIVTGTAPDRQGRQFLNYSFHRTEASLHTRQDTPMFTRAKPPIDAIGAQLSNMDGPRRV